MQQGTITVGEALRFARQLKQLDSEGAEELCVTAFARRVASRCAGIAEKHQRETLEEVPHSEMGSCEHPECCEQRSMSKTARRIKEEIGREFGLE